MGRRYSNLSSTRKNLDLSTVSEASGRYLHQFQWLDDDEIGSIPHSWNWLVNWYRTDKGDGHPEALHFTEGGPWIVDSEYKKTWLNYNEKGTAISDCPIYIETQDGHLEEIRKIELQENQILGAPEPARIVFKSESIQRWVSPTYKQS